MKSVFADIIVYMTIMAFSCISLDSLYNFTHDWLCYKKVKIEAGMTEISSFSEVFKATLHCFCLQAQAHARRMHSS